MAFNKVDKNKVLEQIGRWNEEHPVQTRVNVSGYSEVKTTRTPAMLLFDKKAVIYLEGHNGYFDLDALSLAVSPVAERVQATTEVLPPIDPTRCCMFPGQGSQKKGMGESLFDEFPEMVRVADDVLGHSIKDLCLNDPGKQLGQTQYTQPALYVVNALTYSRTVKEWNARPGFVLGHSLGEYSALFAAGVFDFETGLRLVQRRGALMAEAKGGGMAAVIGMDADQVGKVLRDAGLDAIDLANINSPGQTVISGLKADIDRARANFEAAGARMYVPLEVSGAFHSRYMGIAVDGFRKFLDEFEFKEPILTVISNVEARPHEGNRIKSLLADQLTSPVRWAESIQYLEQQGVSDFKETGPGNVLTGILGQIRRAKAVSTT
jgi:trans-AT polyketide synthase/acyltransferase/oxidoreductase domain-containing protein